MIEGELNVDINEKLHSPDAWVAFCSQEDAHMHLLALPIQLRLQLVGDCHEQSYSNWVFASLHAVCADFKSYAAERVDFFEKRTPEHKMQVLAANPFFFKTATPEQRMRYFDYLHDKYLRQADDDKWRWMAECENDPDDPDAPLIDPLIKERAKAILEDRERQTGEYEDLKDAYANSPDQSVLAEGARLGVREAIQKITNPEILQGLYNDLPDIKDRSAVLERIFDRNFLTNVISGNDPIELRQIAEAKLIKM